MYSGTEKRIHLKKRMEAFSEIFNKEMPIDTKNMTIKAKIFIPFITRGITWPVIVVSSLKKLI